MGPLGYLALVVVQYIIGRVIVRASRPTPKFNMLDLPIVEEGHVIPIAYGLFEMAPQIVWWGDYRHSTGHDGFTSFEAKVHAVVCWGPVDELIDLTFDGKAISKAAQGNYGQPYPPDPFNPKLPIERNGADSTLCYACTLNMFGGESSDGGVAGAVQVFWGTSDQLKSSLLRLKYGTTLTSRYRDLFYMTFGIHPTSTTFVGVPYSFGPHPVQQKNFQWCNNSPYPKPLRIIGRKTPRHADLGQTAAQADMDGNANPMEIIYDMRRNTQYGLGWDSSLFDVSTIIDCMKTLRDEGMGLSVEVNERQSTKEIEEMILDICDAVRRTNQRTGLLEYKLLRADYDLDVPLPTFNESNSSEFSFARGQWSETVNEIRINYREMRVSDTYRGYKPATIIAQNIANWQAQGRIVSEELNFPYITTAAVAQLVAQRRLRVASVPLSKGSFTTNRAGFDLNVGDPFIIHQPRYGIEALYARVTALDAGTLTDRKMKVDWMEDVFGIAESSYTVPPSSEWEEPIPAVLDTANKKLIEMPYWFTPGLDGSRWAMLMLHKNDDSYVGFDLRLSENGGVYSDTRTNLTRFSITGTLTADYTWTTETVDEVGFTVTDLGGMSGTWGWITDDAGLHAGTYMAIIGNEILSIREFMDNGDGTFTCIGVLRGTLDTVPPSTSHAAGAVVYFFQPFRWEGVKATPWVVDLDIDVKPLVTNSAGEISETDVTAVHLTTTSRALAPYPPGHVRMNGETIYNRPDAFDSEGVVLDWKARGRVDQALVIVEQGNATDFIDEGTINVEAYIGAVLVRTEVGVSSGFEYTGAMRYADGGDGLDPVTLKIVPLNGSIIGTVRDLPPTTVIGLGLQLGYYLGGTN